MATVTIVVPDLGAAGAEATVAEWLVSEGDAVAEGDVVVVLETDKVSQEITAEQAGVIQTIHYGVDEDVESGEVLAEMDTDADAAPADDAGEAAESVAQESATAQQASSSSGDDAVKVTPVARNMAREHGVDLSKVSATNGSKIDKADVQAFIDSQDSQRSQPSAPAKKPAPTPSKSASAADMEMPERPRAEDEQREKMSRRRRTIAKHLVEAQQNAAMLTTFNEIDMSGVMELRSRRKENFKEKYGVSLGFTSFFVKAVIGALRAFPRLNAEIEGDYMILKDYYDIGIAVGAEEGLVVPVIRDADRKSFAQIEGDVREYAGQVRDGTLPLEALRGGTFTITNGGVFGSMLSTPILNAPQVGILGLHGIKERPVVVDGEIVIRPIMYTALTYDHRIVDGREAVQFLVKVGELVEDPESLLIEG